MSDLRALYRQTNAIFWQYPKLWVYVLCAELARYTVSLFCSFAQQEVKNHLMPASVFGGYAGGGLESEYKIAVIVAVMAAIANALGLLGYVFALGITAHKVYRLQQGVLSNWAPTGQLMLGVASSGLLVFWPLLSCWRMHPSA